MRKKRNIDYANKGTKCIILCSYLYKPVATSQDKEVYVANPAINTRDESQVNRPGKQKPDVCGALTCFSILNHVDKI